MRGCSTEAWDEKQRSEKDHDTGPLTVTVNCRTTCDRIYRQFKINRRNLCSEMLICCSVSEQSGGKNIFFHFYMYIFYNNGCLMRPAHNLFSPQIGTVNTWSLQQHLHMLRVKDTRVCWNSPFVFFHLQFNHYI